MKHEKIDLRGTLHVTDWLEGIHYAPEPETEIVQVLFKNTRSAFYRNPDNIRLRKGDWVAVEAAPGHDIGQVMLTGPLVRIQMKKANVTPDAEMKRIFRKASEADIEKFHEARAREHETMILSRQIAAELGLNMKIGDVEYQGDGAKAIFYYIADERVDFRKLIRILADTFKIRIEMKQIGARQEAGRIGGIGPCGRPLCCSSWMSKFVSVGTGAARVQDLSMNPQKLAGQCAKLKCCLNFEVDTYVESSKFLPEKNVRLETADNTYYHFKTDIFKKEITYSTDKQMAANLVTIDAERAFEIIEMNRRGEKPLKLEHEGQEKQREKAKPIDLASQDDLTRFDKAKKKKKKKKPQQTGDKPQAPAAQQQPAAAGQARQEQKPQRQEGGDRKPKGQRPAGQKPQPKPQERPERQDKSRNDARQSEQRRDDRQPRQGGQPQGERQGGNQPARQPSQRQGDRQPAPQRPATAPSTGRGPKAFRGEENGNA